MSILEDLGREMALRYIRAKFGETCEGYWVPDDEAFLVVNRKMPMKRRAIAVTFSGKERLQDARDIVDLFESRVENACIAMREAMAQDKEMA
jgi:hypothetical protein